jgi:hypothetical protein
MSVTIPERELEPEPEYTGRWRRVTKPDIGRVRLTAYSNGIIVLPVRIAELVGLKDRVDVFVSDDGSAFMLQDPDEVSFDTYTLVLRKTGLYNLVVTRLYSILGVPRVMGGKRWPPAYLGWRTEVIDGKLSLIVDARPLPREVETEKENTDDDQENN